METLLSLYKQMTGRTGFDRTVLTTVNSRLEPQPHTLGELDEASAKAAECLRSFGCCKGDRVLISLNRPLQIFAFFWGAVKLGAVPCVLFPVLGKGGLTVRLQTADAHFFVTDMDPLKLPEKSALPVSLKKTILTGKPCDDPICAVYQEAEFAGVLEPAGVSPEDDAFMVFTSGTTGRPKPVVHCHRIAEPIVRSMRNVLHAAPDDVYWCTAHPAWITGTVYGLIAPLLLGIPSIQYEGNFHARRWMPILRDCGVTLWYTAPTALRGLMREEAAFFDDYELPALKKIFSIGEPLSEKVFRWGQQTFGLPIYDTWFQTETGTIRIASLPGETPQPGRMGRAVDDTLILSPKAGESGPLVLRAGFGSMFRGYYGMPSETSAKISGDTFVTGDLVSIDREGWIRYEGRADDVINTSGHLVGPLEVEQVLTADPSVAAAAVVSEPDELLYEQPAAFLVLEEGFEWSRELEMKLRVAVNTGVSVYAVPKHFYLVEELPHTMSGKIDRAALRALVRQV